MPSYKITEIASVLNASLKGSPEGTISHLFTDSRTLIPGPGSMFVALRGERHDGHHFIEEVYRKKQVTCFLVEKIPETMTTLPGVTFLVVPDTLQALQALAAWHRSHFSVPVIGITGSNGKTIVKEWLFELLHNHLTITRSPKSYNSQVGVPLSVWLMEPSTQLAIFEAGISRPGEMEKLEKIIRPTIGIFTNIGSAHQENFSSVTEKVKEKLLLFRNASALIYCMDNVVVHQETFRLSSTRCICWSRKNPQANLYVARVDKEEGDVTIISGLYQQEPVQIIIPFTDDASIENAIHCWLLMLHLGYKQDVIQRGMSCLHPVAMRLEIKKGINFCTLINDAYNSDLQSLSIALDVLNQQHQHPVKTLILSDIQQSGKEAAALYGEVASLLQTKGVNKFIGIGHEISAHARLFGSGSMFFLSTDEFLRKISRTSFHNEAILIKGSRSFRFERISDYLEQKSHRTVLEINLNAIVHNLNYFRSKLKPSVKIIAMVKAFAYGSGAYEIANVLQYHKVDYLAVAFADEGVALREAGITMPVIVMNPEQGTYPWLVDYKLEPEIYNLQGLQQLIDTLKIQRVYGFPVHIKLDTGMHRLGFDAAELDELIHVLHNNDNIRVASVFSHLAASDEPAQDDFTREQIKRFETMSQQLLRSLSYPVARHLLNSAGIERFPQAQYDMVRLGIGLYGIGIPLNQPALLPVSSFKSTILQIKTIHAGETVGYSRKFKATQDTVVGIVPVGYADGLPRLMGNGKASFWINGKLAPVIGNVCMDMCMVNLTDIDAAEGDEVEIFGNHISITTFAEQMGTIPYEVLTGVSSRVKRIYYQE